MPQAGADRPLVANGPAYGADPAHGADTVHDAAPRAGTPAEAAPGAVRTLVFDLDGTLVDSVPDLADAARRMLARRALPAVSDAQVTAMVGDGVAVLVRRLFAHCGRVPDDAAQGEFLADYTAHAADRTLPYPGVAEGLARLRESGWRLAVCTNKPVEPARHLLAGLGLLGHFAAVTGGDSFAVRKPDPDHVRQTLALAGGVAARAVMVGDNAHDITAGRGAGLRTIHAGWGYGTPAMARGADAVAAGFGEVAELAESLVG